MNQSELHYQNIFKDQKPKWAKVIAVDVNRSADWNIKKLKPAVLLQIQDKAGAFNLSHIPARVTSLWCGEDSGFWFPPRVGQIGLCIFRPDYYSPVFVGEIWDGKGSKPPTEGDEYNAVLKLGGHTINVDEKSDRGGISLKTKDGIQVTLENVAGNFQLQLIHPTGTKITIDKDGNINITVKGDWNETVEGDKNVTIEGDWTQTVKGNVEIRSDGSVYIEGKLSVTLKSDTQITLETLGILSGILTALTHPVCMLMGVPNGASTTVQGDA